ncbi:Transmembrane protein [Echinococcus granulosus]|uniref:Transmembrane protein n=1 Tax=Echinococcus granulosus TaxID=6210 RepID=W6USY5_ECHGR|nr:Transmembrane protein [Echinococcus granulosus]EUB64760.1 Transmembrane protein [Echinococcus granulosus]
MSYAVSLRMCTAYGFIHFCISLVHNIFIVYHVQVFVSNFAISKFSFWFSEIIFLVWNSVNDSIFGWLIDKHLLSGDLTDKAVASRRARVISHCGPFLALAFTSTWFPQWLPNFPGIRFMLVLCCYDSVITLLDLMKGALLADLAVSQSDRSRLGCSASVGQALSAIGLVFHCHFNSNFFPLFSKSLLGLGHENLSCAILGMSFVLPHINNVFLLKASEVYGTYVVIRDLFFLKVVLGIFLLFSGPSNLMVMSLFLASNRVFTEGICRLLPQVISDLVDEDLVLNRRPQPVSALIFGATSLLGRPGQSFAPLVGYALLSLLTGGYKGGVSVAADTLRVACFTLAWSLVLLVGLAQLAIWSSYRLHGAYLARIKKERLTITGQKSPHSDILNLSSPVIGI